jgi:DNA polymerase-3 subunit chi
MATVEFYVLSDAAPDAHLRHACRLAEQAVEQGHRVFVRAGESDVVRRIDDLLWTFGDRSFLPHEITVDSSPTHSRIRILIGSTPPKDFRDVVINLAVDVPADRVDVSRIAEFVPADSERKAAARERFKYYRAQGVEPVTHNL